MQSVKKVKGRLPAGVTIYNALRVALRIISGKIIFICSFETPAGVSKLLFHGRGRKVKRHLQRRFLRKRGAAGESFWLLLGGNPSQSSLRDASSPEGGALFVLTGRWQKAPPSGELDATSGSGLRGFSR